MHFETIRDAQAWAALSAEWNALLKRSHQNTPFLTYEFQQAWWLHKGGGEWSDPQLNIVVARNEAGDLLGIAPLFRADRQGQPVLYLIGTHEIADFLDFIVSGEDLVAFSQGLVAYLAADDAWQNLDLYNLLSTSKTAYVLETAAGKQGWTVQRETLQPSPYLDIPASLEDYIASLDAKQAHELRRKMRRAARNPEPITLELALEPAELDKALSDFFGLMTQEEDKVNFLTPVMHEQMDAIARAAFAGGWLHLAFIKAGDQRIAGYMNFDYDNRIWAYNAGFNNAYASLSPGWLIMAELVRWCAENGRAVFDFMRGGEEYKYRFGGKDRYVERLTITRPVV